MSPCCLSVAQAPLATTRAGETEGSLRVYMSKNTSAKSKYVFTAKSGQKSVQSHQKLLIRLNLKPLILLRFSENTKNRVPVALVTILSSSPCCKYIEAHITCRNIALDLGNVGTPAF